MFPKLPDRPTNHWKETILKKSYFSLDKTIDTYCSEAEWQEMYDAHKNRREGQFEVEIRQNTYLIQTWAFTIPNLLIGVYHTGIDVIRLGEYSFDSRGIYRLSYDEVRDIDVLQYSGCASHYLETNYNTIEMAVEELRNEFPPGSYDSINKNCHHFCDALTTKLGLPPLKSKYTKAARAYRSASSTWDNIKQQFSI